ncbi:hypothetical protein ACVIGA_004262 [Bradyrhizobium sp. USDA 3240]
MTFVANPRRVACTGNRPVAPVARLTREPFMRIHNLYADEDGETHFRDIEIELSETGPDGTTSRTFPATGIIFRTTPGDWYFDWHQATRRQYVINLDAPHEVIASDGETRTIGIGEIILYEDVRGKGHLSRGLGTFRRSVMIPAD